MTIGPCEDSAAAVPLCGVFGGRDETAMPEKQIEYASESISIY